MKTTYLMPQAISSVEISSYKTPQDLINGGRGYYKYIPQTSKKNFWGHIKLIPSKLVWVWGKDSVFYGDEDLVRAVGEEAIQIFIEKDPLLLLKNEEIHFKAIVTITMMDGTSHHKYFDSDAEASRWVTINIFGTSFDRTKVINL